MEQQEHPFTAGWKTTWYSHFGSQFFSFLQKYTSNDLATAFLGVYPKELKTCLHKNLYMDVYSSLFITAEIWKLPRRPSVGELINKLWYIQTMEYYLALKRNELPSQEKTEET